MNYGRFFIAPAVDSTETTRERLTISGNNFEIIFDGEKRIAKWGWKNKPLLHCRIDFYKMDKAVYSRFKSEVERWIGNKWLVKTNCSGDGVIPLMAVVQEKKNKVRPVLDFLELNEFVECSEADADVCEEKLRSWRQKSSNCALLDLRDAYTQIGMIDEYSKYRYQIVEFEGDYYMLRRLGFGLDCAPKIMKAAVFKVLSLDKNIFKATDQYYNDIIIDLNIVSVEKVKEHLLRFGLATKPAENLCSAKVLSLQTYEKKELFTGGKLS